MRERPCVLMKIFFYRFTGYGFSVACFFNFFEVIFMTRVVGKVQK